VRNRPPGIIDPFGRGALITAQLAEWIRQATPDPGLASALGRAAFVVGDFDSGLTFASRACDGLRQLSALSWPPGGAPDPCADGYLRRDPAPVVS
jgi:hypothetical protein